MLKFFADSLDSLSQTSVADSQTSDAASNSTTDVTGFDWSAVFNEIWHWLCTNGVRLLLGLIALFILFKIVNAFARMVKNRMEARHSDKTITSIVYKLIRSGLKFLLVLLLISYVGIETTGIGVIISSLGVGISLAVQGSLSNLAGGIVILLMKPFGIGDFITAQDCSGTVEEIKMFYTYLVTPDNKVQMIPNGILANGVITNVSKKNTRRVDMVFSISYNSSVDKAKEIIKRVELNHPKVFHTPEPFIVLGEFADSSVNITSRVWVKSEDYWSVFFELNDQVYKAFNDEGIEIPYSQIDVHLKNKD